MTTKTHASAGPVGSPPSLEAVAGAGKSLASSFQAVTSGAGATANAQSFSIEGAGSAQSVKPGVIAILVFALAY